MQEKEEQERRRKSRINAQTNAFTCLLVYFTVKAIVLIILFKYDNFLKHNPSLLIPFIILLFANAYMMLTAGKDPGFEPILIEQNQLLMYERNQHNFCSICNCRRKNRSKHCYECGRCVRKFDHHCPWIGACVGQKNHGKFWALLLAHTLQSSLAFHILFESMKMQEYEKADGSYGQQYGVFLVFSIFMILYILFAGGLLAFHTYLLLFNVTTRQLTSREKCKYLSGVRGNPFSKGLLQNLKVAVLIQQNGSGQSIQKRQDPIDQDIGFMPFGLMITTLVVDVLSSVCIYVLFKYQMLATFLKNYLN